MANYPLAAYHFNVEWGGARTSFAEVRGLDKYIEPIAIRDGAMPSHHATFMPGLEKFNTITLRRAIERGDNDFTIWMDTKAGSTIERRDVVVSLLDETHTPVFRWLLTNCFPIRYSGPVFIAGVSGAAYEELELIHEGITVRPV